MGKEKNPEESRMAHIAEPFDVILQSCHFLR